MERDTRGDLLARLTAAEEECLRWERARLDAQAGLMVLLPVTCAEQVDHWKRVAGKLRRRLTAARRKAER